MLTEDQKTFLAEWFAVNTRPEKMLIGNYWDKRLLFRARRLLGGGEVRQVAALAVIKAIGKWNPDRSRFKSFVYRSIKWALLTSIRDELFRHRAKQADSQEQLERPVDYPDPDEDKLARLAVIRIVKASELSKREFELLTRHRGMLGRRKTSTGDLAEDECVTYARIRQIVERAEKKLKDYAELHPETDIYR